MPTALIATTPGADLLRWPDRSEARGLGNYINARMIVSVFRDLDATHVYELVSASNAPSRRMVMSCGLRQEQGLGCGIAMPNDSAHFTR